MKDMITIEEAAQILNCSPRTVYNYIKSGRLKKFKSEQRVLSKTQVDKLRKEQ